MRNRKSANTTMKIAALAGLSVMLLGTVNAQADTPQIKVPMPGQWGDQYVEELDDPEAVDRIEAVQRLRQQKMRIGSGYYRAMEQILRYGAPGKDELPGLAADLARHAERFPASFAEESPARPGEPGALPTIWQDPTFEEYVAAFRRETQALETATQTLAEHPSQEHEREAVKALNDVRHQCLACHDAFRRR